MAFTGSTKPGLAWLIRRRASSEAVDDGTGVIEAEAKIEVVVEDEGDVKTKSDTDSVLESYSDSNAVILVPFIFLVGSFTSSMPGSPNTILSVPPPRISVHGLLGEYGPWWAGTQRLNIMGGFM